MKQKISIPILRDGQCSVFFAEINTGILLDSRMARDTDNTLYHQVFDTEGVAIAFAKAFVDKNPAIECALRDASGNHLMFVRKGQ